MSSKSERHNPEKVSPSQWIYMRDPNRPISTHEEYGQVSWNPALIPGGKSLLIDVQGVNRWLHDLKIVRPVEIKPYTPPIHDGDKTSVSHVSASGEAVGSGMLSIRRAHKPSLSTIAADDGAFGQSILINFDGIRRYIQREHPDSTSQEQDHLYAKMVNRALKATGPKMVSYNVIAILQERPYLIEEYRAKLAVDAVTSFALSLGMATLIAQGEFEPQNVAVLVGVMGLFNMASFQFWNMVNVIKAMRSDNQNMWISKNEDPGIMYGQYLLDQQKNWPIKLFFPFDVLEQLYRPMASSLTRKTLIKAAN